MYTVASGKVGYNTTSQAFVASGASGEKECVTGEENLFTVLVVIAIHL